MKKNIGRWLIGLVVAMVTMVSSCLADSYVEVRVYEGTFIFVAFTNAVTTYWRAYDGLATDHYVDKTTLEVKRLPAIPGNFDKAATVAIWDVSGEGLVPTDMPIPVSAIFYRTTTERQKFTVFGTNITILPASQMLVKDVVTTYKGKPQQTPGVYALKEHLTQSYGSPDWNWRFGEGAGGYQSFVPRPSVVGAPSTTIDNGDVVIKQCKAFTLRVDATGINPDPSNPNTYLMCKVRGVSEAGYEAVIATQHVSWNTVTEVRVDLSGPGETRAYGIYPELWRKIYPPTNPPPQTN